MDTNQIRIGITALIVGSLALAACGGSGDDTAASHSNTTITSNRQAASVATDAIDSAIDLGTDPTSTTGKSAPTFKHSQLSTFSDADTRLARLAPIEDALFAGMRKNAAAARAARSHSGTISTCTVSGSGQYTTDATDSVTIFTYTDCNDGNSIWDGTITVTETADASGSQYTAVWGSGDGILGNGNDFRITLLASDGTVEAHYYLDERIEGIITHNDAGDTVVNLTVNGRARIEYVDGTQYEVAYNGLRAVVTESSDGLRRSVVYNGSVDATLLYAGSSYNKHIGYSDFAVSASATSTHVMLTLSGTIDTASVPTSCSDGRYTFVTRESLRYNRATGIVESGTIAINDNTVVTFANGNMTVTVNGAAVTYSQGTVGASCPVN